MYNKLLTHELWEDLDIATNARMTVNRVATDAIVAATTNTIGIKEKGKDRMDHTDRVFKLTLRSADGRERRTLAWFPNEAVRQDYYEKARKCGLEITEHRI